MEAVNREADAWAKALRGGDDEMRSSDPMVFGKPRAPVRRKEGAARGRDSEVVSF